VLVLVFLHNSLVEIDGVSKKSKNPILTVSVFHLQLTILLLESVLPGFLPCFPSQIWVGDVTFVTFFYDKKCDASHLSHFWEECDALAHEIISFSL